MIRQFVDAINEQLVSRGAILQPGDCQICLEFGEERDAENDSPPRAVIFPTNDTFEAPWNPGGNQRPVKNVSTGLEIHAFGRDYDETETLRDQIVLAIHASAYGAYVLQGGAWDRTTLRTQYGRKYVLRLTVQAPIADIKLATAKANSKTQTSVTMKFPAGDQGTVEIETPIKEAT